MNLQQLTERIFSSRNYLCVGLDTDPRLIPAHLGNDPGAVLSFNREIINATKKHCVAYKINTAFYEAMGPRGWEVLAETAASLPETHFRIADAKRGDIGNTSAQYARAFFEQMDFDAVTVAPYMGEDSVRPFLEYGGKWTILLGLTSNAGARDFEMQRVITHTDLLDEGVHIRRTDDEFLYEMVLRKAASWGTPGNLMFVIGATRPEAFARIRGIIPSHFLLVPGVGAQGGSLREISETAMNPACGLLVNASRSIIFASGAEDFAEKAAAAASAYSREMDEYLTSLEKQDSM